MHVESCYQTAAEKTPLCGHEAHTHTADCYDETGALICALEEHTHTDACYEPAAEKNAALRARGAYAHRGLLR